jgi:uncharacterized membrane protein YkvA (DUF1232 family)
MNNKVLKVMLIALLAVYVISPVDLAPGPVDDLLLILFSAVMNQMSSNRSKEMPKQIEGSWKDSSNQ